MKIFGGISESYTTFERSEVILQPILYDGTSTWKKGSDQALEAILDASLHMETFDFEFQKEVYQKGIHIPESWEGYASPEEMVEDVSKRISALLPTNKKMTFLGGEHSISIGTLRAYSQAYPNLSVLQLDAHTDLRPEYEGSKYNHACAMHEVSKTNTVVQVGIRSMDKVETEFLNPDNVFYAIDIRGNSDWHKDALDRLKGPVYISLDLDVFDPSILPATGTPEPGGLNWYDVTGFLRKVFAEKEVIAFDMVELCPMESHHSSNFTAALLYYKMLNFWFYL